MLKNFLTGGIDLPKLASDVAGIRTAIKDAASQGRPHLGEGTTVAEVIYWLLCRIDKLDIGAEVTNAALADHIGKANERMTTAERVQSDNTAQCQIRMNGLHDLIASRALAEDVDTLRLKVERVDGDNTTTSEELHDAVQKLAAIKANNDDIAAMRATVVSLAATVGGLNAKVEALTATKLSEMKARKAPKK